MIKQWLAITANGRKEFLECLFLFIIGLVRKLTCEIKILLRPFTQGRFRVDLRPILLSFFGLPFQSLLLRGALLLFD